MPADCAAHPAGREGHAEQAELVRNMALPVDR